MRLVYRPVCLHAACVCMRERRRGGRHTYAVGPARSMARANQSAAAKGRGAIALCMHIARLAPWRRRRRDPGSRERTHPPACLPSPRHPRGAHRPMTVLTAPRMQAALHELHPRKCATANSLRRQGSFPTQSRRAPHNGAAPPLPCSFTGIAPCVALHVHCDKPWRRGEGGNRPARLLPRRACTCRPQCTVPYLHKPFLSRMWRPAYVSRMRRNASNKAAAVAAKLPSCGTAGDTACMPRRQFLHARLPVLLPRRSCPRSTRRMKPLPTFLALPCVPQPPSHHRHHAAAAHSELRCDTTDSAF